MYMCKLLATSAFLSVSPSANLATILQCQIRNRECNYRPSRRGGARVRKKRRPSEQPQYSQSETSTDDNRQKREYRYLPISFITKSCEELRIENFIEPGAGLKELPDFFHDSDFIFDTIFAPDKSVINDLPENHPIQIPSVRTYQNDRAM
jgi:hypothetical protein